MRSIFIMCVCMLCSPLFAETIGEVEYFLPEGAKDWIIGKKLEDENTKTLLFVPKNSTVETSRELFGVNANPYPSDFTSDLPIKQILSQFYPNMQIEVIVLDRTKDDILYEWYAKDEGLEKIHGWTHAFAQKNGTAVVMYQTQDVTDLDKTRAIWLPAIQNARLKHAEPALAPAN